MRILIVTATLNEAIFFEEIKMKLFTRGYDCELLVTGIGIVNSVHALTKRLEGRKYDVIWNAGICGSFTKSLEIGEPVLIIKDSFAELGIDDKGVFSAFPGLNSTERVSTLFQNHENIPITIPCSSFNNAVLQLKKVSGITVQTVTGSEDRINEMQKRFSPDVESMEGAAILFVCRQYSIPCIPIRTVSNYVEKRNPEHWRIHFALESLALFFNSAIV